MGAGLTQMDATQTVRQVTITVTARSSHVYKVKARTSRTPLLGAVEHTGTALKPARRVRHQFVGVMPDMVVTLIVTMMA